MSLEAQVLMAAGGACALLGAMILWLDGRTARASTPLVSDAVVKQVPVEPAQSMPPDPTSQVQVSRTEPADDPDEDAHEPDAVPEEEPMRVWRLQAESTTLVDPAPTADLAGPAPSETTAPLEAPPESDEAEPPPTVVEAFVDWQIRLGVDEDVAWARSDSVPALAHRHDKLGDEAGEVARCLEVVEQVAPDLFDVEQAQAATLEFVRTSLGPGADLIWPSVGDLASDAESDDHDVGPVARVVRPGFTWTDHDGTTRRLVPVVSRSAR